MDFYAFRDEYSSGKKQDRLIPLLWAHTGKQPDIEPTPVEFYEVLMKSVLSLPHLKQYGNSAITQHILSSAMKRWYMDGKPYVKIWPQMAQKLMHTKLDVATKHLKLPYGAFEIRLPKIDNPFKTTNTPELRSVFVIHCEGTYSLSGAESRQLLIWFDLGQDDYEAVIDYHQPTYGYLHLRLCDEMTLEDTLEKSNEENFANESALPINAPPKEFYRAVLSMALCTCFFMTSSHDLVCPDIPNRYAESFKKAKAEDDQATMDRILKKSAKSGMRGGHTLGREIELPRPIRVKSEGDSEPSSQTWHQRFSHVRSGHLRLQAYGPKLSQRKVLFIEPTVVKPYLPPKPNVGFAIKDTVLRQTI